MTTLFGCTHTMPEQLATPVTRKKRGLLPLLTVVFIFSYGLMTLLIVEQGAAIQQQHNLIQVLLGDSRELWAIKGKVLTDKSARDQAQKNAQSQASSTQAPTQQTPSTQAQSQPAQSRSAQTRSAQTKTGKAAGPQTQSPQTQAPHDQVPPMPASDLSDRRRVLIAL